MKKSLIILAIFASFSAHSAPAKSYKYTCACVDTGMECEGAERMEVAVSETKAKIKISMEDGDFPLSFETQYNPDYQAPGKYRNYSQYKISSMSKPEYSMKSSFLVDGEMPFGAKTGTVLFQSIARSSGFYSWLYECEKN